MSTSILRCGLVTAVLLVAVTAPAAAHIEREPIFVDPAADARIFPPAGGAFVAARRPTRPELHLRRFQRSVRIIYRRGATGPRRAALLMRYARLSKAQQRAGRRYTARQRRGRRGPSVTGLGLKDPKVQAQETLVVCRPDSMRRLDAAIAQIRATAAGRRELPLTKARRLRRDNRRFARLCRFDEIQPAVMAADNGDTVLLMPGFYTEPTSRAQPHNDPRCAELVERDEGGFQELGGGATPSGPPASGAPTYAYHSTCPNDISLVTLIGKDPQGNCLRCNVQMHGTGARPEDVLVSGGRDIGDPGVTGDHFEEGRGLVPSVKEIGIRVERGDGSVLRNFTVRDFSEHGVYGMETDGMTVERMKLFYAREYGHLSFVTDHNTVQDSEAAGSADAGLYPGAAPPSRPRINTIVRRNYAHHNVLGYSGTMGSNTRIVDNDFSQNSAGISLDSFYRAGHPGFPQNSTVIERNRVYSNNFDTYSDKAWVKSSVQAPIGVGMFLAGGNDNVYKDNFIYDNWRWGAFLSTVPDALSNNFEKPPEREDAELSTSYRNRYEGNTMGRSPAGEELPNGTDFWWDELGQGNCWQNNSPGPITSDPAELPDCQGPSLPRPNPAKEAYLASCAFAMDPSPGSPGCDWFTVPPRPERRR